MTRRTCRCQQFFPPTSRPSSFIPFHRRPRATPAVHSDPSIRTKTESTKSENTTDSTDHANPPLQADNSSSQATSSPLVTNQIAPNSTTNSIGNNSATVTNEKTTEWTASTPHSVSISGPPSVLAPITNHNSIQTPSPAPVSTANRGIKRSATAAFDDLNIAEDEEREQHKQTYDFHRTDTL